MCSAATIQRHSEPSAGRTMAAMVEARAVHIRRAVEILRVGFSGRVNRTFRDLFESRWNIGHEAEESVVLRAAWALVNVLLLARLEGKGNDIATAEDWFFPVGIQKLSPLLTAESIVAAEESIDNLSFDTTLRSLLPYILEPYGPGSRLSVLKDASTSIARNAKKTSGVFYTPSDVADYIVKFVLKPLPKNAQLLDPSCGTGVFLLAALRAQQEGLSYLASHLHGVDKSHLAVESCTFVLLNGCADTYQIPPWCAWHLIRLNLAAFDSLKLNNEQNDTSDSQALAKRQIQASITSGCVPPPHHIHNPNRASSQCSTSILFPEASEGFHAVVGNPPYTKLGNQENGTSLERFASVPRYSSTVSTYPLFLEMMWQLARKQHSCSGMVVPLSIAYHQGQQMSACRKAMMDAQGQWSCAFFDREPHALFGEDVKTRNAIVFHSNISTPIPRIAVTSLIKWTSRTRPQLFSAIEFTDIGSIDIQNGIPKLGNAVAAAAYSALTNAEPLLGSLCTRIVASQQADAFQASKGHRVFVASTAYNFLNIFRPLSLAGNIHSLSENSIHCLECETGADARIVFAILSSRLVYWLWHTLGDGFHVSRKFLSKVPFGRGMFDNNDRKQLAGLGARLWKSLQEHRICSTNRGRRTIAFRPLACVGIRDEIDRLIVNAAELDIGFVDMLRAFVENTVIVDPTDKTRSHLKSYFNQVELHP